MFAINFAVLKILLLYLATYSAFMAESALFAYLQPVYY